MHPDIEPPHTALVAHTQYLVKKFFTIPSVCKPAETSSSVCFINIYVCKVLITVVKMILSDLTLSNFIESKIILKFLLHHHPPDDLNCYRHRNHQIGRQHLKRQPNIWRAAYSLLHYSYSHNHQPMANVDLTSMTKLLLVNDIE